MTKKKIINFIRDNWAVIGFLISFVLNSKYQILENLFNNNLVLVDLAKGLGLLLVAYFTKEKLGISNRDIGGSNPPPNKDEK